MPMTKFADYPSITFKLTAADAGLYVVTSPDIRGVHIVGKSPDEAFAELPRVCRALLDVHDAEPNDALRQWFGPQIDATATLRK